MAQLESKQLNKIGLHENATNRNMDEKLLLKCENSIRAYKIVNLLNKHNIALRQHDESQDPRVGAYGAVTGIAIYVFAKEYEKALSIVSPILKDFNTISTFCPKCGSENVKPITGNHKYITYLIFLCLFLILTPGIYIALPEDFGLRSSLINKIALMMVALGFILMPIINHYNVNYKCKKCGNRFRHY